MIDGLAAICIAAIFIGLLWLVVPWLSSRANPMPILIGFGPFVG